MTRRVMAWCLLPMLLAGCVGPPFQALALDGWSRQAAAEVADTELFDVLRVGAPVLSRDAEGRLTMTMAVASLDEEPLAVVATVRFVDGNGCELRGQTVRQRLRLETEATAQCAAVATDGTAEACVVCFDWDR